MTDKQSHRGSNGELGRGLVREANAVADLARTKLVEEEVPRAVHASSYENLGILTILMIGSGLTRSMSNRNNQTKQTREHTRKETMTRSCQRP